MVFPSRCSILPASLEDIGADERFSGAVDSIWNYRPNRRNRKRAVHGGRRGKQVRAVYRPGAVKTRFSKWESGGKPPMPSGFSGRGQRWIPGPACLRADPGLTAAAFPSAGQGTWACGHQTTAFQKNGSNCGRGGRSTSWARARGAQHRRTSCAAPHPPIRPQEPGDTRSKRFLTTQVVDLQHAFAKETKRLLENVGSCDGINP